MSKCRDARNNIYRNEIVQIKCVLLKNNLPIKTEKAYQHVDVKIQLISAARIIH